MTSRDFCYWLQGLFELSDCDKNKPNNSLSMEQVACLRNHLNMVFVHEIDPSHGNKEHQALLSKVHGGISAIKQGDILWEPPKMNC